MVSKNIEENVNVQNVIDTEAIQTLNNPFLDKHKKKAMKKTKINPNCIELHRIANENFVVIACWKGSFILCKHCRKFVKGGNFFPKSIKK